MEQSLEEILTLLQLERLEDNLFRGLSPKENRPRVFGGQVLGQALSAAYHTVDGLICHSFHSYFLRGGDPSAPIIYEVDQARDGRSFASRRVTVIQHGKQIFNMAASFQVPEKGREHQIDMPDAPPPEDVPSENELREKDADKVPKKWRDTFLRRRPFETRPINPNNLFEAKILEPKQMVWLKADPGMPDAIATNQAMLAYMSDTTLLGTCLRPHALTYMNPNLQSASLDHAMWFYHPFKADEWLLYVQNSPASVGGRGMNFGDFFTQDGKLVCSSAQEGLIRVRD